MFKKSIWGHSFIIFLLVSLIISCAAPTFANDIKDKRNELKDVQQEIENSKDILKEASEKEKSLLLELEHLNQEIAQIEQEISVIGGEIKRIDGEIAVLNEEIAEQEEEIAKLDEFLPKRLRYFYENGRVSYLEVLFDVTNFTDFLYRVTSIKRIIENDTKMIQDYQMQKEALEVNRRKLEEQKQELAELQAESEAKKADVVVKKAEREQLLAEAQEEIAAQEEAIAALEKEADKISEIIKQLEEEERKKQDQGGTASRGNGQFLWPVQGYGPAWITSRFGYRTHPITGVKGSFHGGLDIGIPHNRWPGSASYNGSYVNVLASDGGIASTAYMAGGYGNYIIINHGNGFSTIYGHLHGYLVSNGQVVEKGQPIGIVGSTGASTGPHLHFEIRKNGQRLDPLGYLR